jgi:dienelactone hydrolase
MRPLLGRGAGVCAVVAGLALTQAGPALQVEPADGLIDAATTIVVSGLAARQQVVIAARAVDSRNQAFASQARFNADDRGVVDVATAKASGSYSGVDAMGLFWSMEPERRAGSPDEASRFAVGGRPIQYEFNVLVDGRVVATGHATRRRAGAGLRTSPVFDRSLVATVTVPAGEGKHPAILHFGGSEGGLPRDPARVELLASRGYVVLSLAYFNAPGRPPILKEIPLEYFRTALDWLKDQPYVDGGRIGIMSASRGSEAALLLAVLFEDVRAVVAIAPQSVMWGGWDPAAGRGVGTPSWTYQGRSLAYVSILPGRCGRAGGSGADVLRCALMEYHEAVMHATIPVDKAKAPLLLIAGLDDRVSPSELMAKQIEDRRARAHVADHDVALYLRHAGHMLPTWYGPPVLDFGHVGGDREGAAKAFEQAWPAILHFLHLNLGGNE